MVGANTRICLADFSATMVLRQARCFMPSNQTKSSLLASFVTYSPAATHGAKDSPE